jgi:hypothetical protein
MPFSCLWVGGWWCVVAWLRRTTLSPHVAHSTHSTSLFFNPRPSVHTTTPFPHHCPRPTHTPWVARMASQRSSLLTALLFARFRCPPPSTCARTLSITIPQHTSSPVTYFALHSLLLTSPLHPFLGDECAPHADIARSRADGRTHPPTYPPIRAFFVLSLECVVECMRWEVLREQIWLC